MKKLLLLICVFISAINFAQTHTWTGNGGDLNWFNSSNWDAGTVPDASSNVLIENSTVEIITNAAEANSIALEETAVLVLENTLSFSQEFTIAENATFQWNDGIIENGTIENDGVINIETLEQKDLNDIIINNRNEIAIVDSGTISLLGTTTINNENAAEININSPGGLIEDSGTATINNDGVIRKLNNGGPGAFYMIFDMNNMGVILLEEEQIFLFLVGSQNFINSEDGFLLGTGSYDITANFENNGFVSPAASNTIGHLEFVNNFNFPPNAILEIDVQSPSEHDMVNIFGSPTIEGNILLNLMDELALEDELTVITSSNNLTCNLPSQIGADSTSFQYTFDVICDTNSVTLKVVEKLELLGIEDFSEKIYLVASPNPASDNVSFSYPSDLLYNDKLSLEIYSILGQKKMSFPVNLETTNFNTSPLSSGLYIVNLVSEKGVLATHKLIIE